MNKPPLVIYHQPCSDGLLAAWAVLQYHKDVEFFPGRHGDLPPDATGRDVILVDFSYKRRPFLELLEHANTVTLLDHHVSAERELGDIVHPKLAKVIDQTRSGAGIAWDVYNGGPRPALIRHVEDRDIWAWKYSDTRAVTELLFYQMENLTPNSHLLNDIVLSLDTPSGYNVWKSIGEQHLKKIDEVIDAAVNAAKPVTFDGYETLATHADYKYASDVGHKLATKTGTFAIVYNRWEGKWKLSFRAVQGFDVSRLAEAHGGGGHPGAASCFMGSLPWE